MDTVFNKVSEFFALPVLSHPVIIGAISLLGLYVLSRLADRACTRATITFQEKFGKRLIDDRVIENSHKPVFYSVFAVGATELIRWFDLSSSLIEKFVFVLASLAIFFWSLLVIIISKKLLQHAARTRRSSASLVQVQTLPLFENLALLVIFIVSAYLLFSLWGVDMTAWLASAGIAGIAIGFAAKDSLANLISGVWILADGPYNIGDYVVLDGGERGRVTHIGLRSTRMFTRDYTEVSVPNAVIGNAKIVNESAGINPKYRVRVPVGVSYGSNIDLVEKTLLEVATKSDLICEDPAPICRFRKFGASSVDYEMMGWVEDPELRGRAVHFLNREVYLAFEKLGIEIPYSKQDLYIKSLPRQD